MKLSFADVFNMARESADKRPVTGHAAGDRMCALCAEDDECALPEPFHQRV
jgi:hypothetical protein